jgi:ectoine hydroxylase-related dioxygenase (phytanoyl-CoA dioxygenase family)
MVQLVTYDDRLHFRKQIAAMHHDRKRVIAAGILDAVKVNLCGDRLLSQKGTVSAPKFSRDETLLPVAEGRGCAVGISLDPVDKRDAMAFVAGSHRWRDEPGNREMRAKAMEGEETIRFATRPGDLVIHHLRMFSAGGVNSSARERRTLWLSYGAEDMCLRRRSGVLSHVFHREPRMADCWTVPNFLWCGRARIRRWRFATLYDNPSFSEQTPKERK